MRFRTHLLSSLAAGLAIYGPRPVPVAALVAAGTLIDVDHVVLYALQTGDWSLFGAVRYDRYRHKVAGAGDNRPRYGSLRSWLHEPLLLLPTGWLAAAGHPWLRPLALGVGLHLLLDHYDWPARYGEHLRSRGVCRACGRSGRRLSVARSGRRGAYSYRAICRACAERSAMGGRGGPRQGRRGRQGPRV